ncbi:MAG: class I tRNA ligase family protein [Nitrospinae bacterium]|nr:class I tRNA ligase family protein [Nitrospinota bacterium]
MFHADVNAGFPPFPIVIPPPNITGSLHMDRTLNKTLQHPSNLPRLPREPNTLLPQSDRPEGPPLPGL